MRYYYKYIIDKCGEPKWFDEYAVPRYEPMHPKNVANIYSNAVIFSLVACQNCGKQFKVTFSQSHLEELNMGKDIIKEEKMGMLYWGDPPHTACCPGGPAMTANYIDTLEIWKKINFEWEKI